MGISLKAEIIRQGFKLGVVAETIKMSPATFSRKAKTNQFTLPEAEKILSSIGLKLHVVELEKNLQQNG